MERQVQPDCQSEILRVLVEEHNKAVAFMYELAQGVFPTDNDIQDRMPQTITLRRNDSHGDENNENGSQG